ncbi:MAG: phosphatase PAP2 family protein [Nitrospirae bacterium]|jgi:membrane-associated phospholipid phosphatase|nr:phosphatase PAP2 family protein [Nitrospirota bacterium]
MNRIKQILIRNRPADIISILFVSFLLFITLFFYSVLPKPKYLISLYTILLIIQFILIKIRKNNRILNFIYNLGFPSVCILLVFDSLEWIVHYVNPKDIDPLLIKLDYLLFGNHPTVMLERFMNPLLTDILQVAYSTYYFIPIGLGIILLMKKNEENFNKSLFLILLCFYLSYLGYILFPALGPRFYLKELQTVELQGYLIAEPLINLLNRLEGIKRDAFPSGHTGITILVLYLSWKYSRRFFWIALPVVSALIFATVYCRYHYVVDVIAGFILFIITIVIGEWYYKWWSKKI